MKSLRYLPAIILAITLPSLVWAAQITVPSATQSGQVLVSQPNGTYAPQATSTLGLSSIFIGAGGAGISATTTITQASHGFTAGQWVGISGNQYALANAVAGGVYQGVGIVASVTDANHFVLQTAGDFTDTNLIPGMSYYLSASSTASLGSIVGYPPSTVGAISAPVAIAKTQTTATINIGRPSIVSQATASFGMNVGNDQIGNTYYATSSNVADAAILLKNLADKRVRIAMPSYNNPIGIYNMRQLALYYKGLGFFVSYGVTGLSGVQNTTTYNAWKAQVIATELPWACANGINRLFLGNEEVWQAQIGNFGGGVTGTGVRNDVRSMSSTARTYANANGCSSMEIVYSTAEGTVAQWGALGGDYGALDKVGFNVYNTLSGFDNGVAYFQSQIGPKFFASEWAANHPYYDMVNGGGENDATYAADLSSRQQTLTNRGVESYFFALRYGGNTLTSGNWNILLNTGAFNPGASAAFGGGAGNAVKPTPIILTDNQKLYMNTVKTAYFDADTTDFRITAPLYGTLKIAARASIISTQTPQLQVGYDTSNYYNTTIGSSGSVTLNPVGSGAAFSVVLNGTGGVGYIKNSNSAGYSALDLLDSNGVDVAGFGFGNSTTAAAYRNKFYIGTNTSSSSIAFIPNGTLAMSIVNGGNVGIATATPATALDVNGLVRVYQTSTTTCSASIEGSIFYSSTGKHFYGCNGTTWNQLDN